MNESDVTDEQILEEAKVLFENPQLRRCNACAHANDDCTWCFQMKKPLTRYMYAGMCKFFETGDCRHDVGCHHSHKRQTCSRG